jgi:hypothetical protein
MTDYARNHTVTAAHGKWWVAFDADEGATAWPRLDGRPCDLNEACMCRRLLGDTGILGDADDRACPQREPARHREHVAVVVFPHGAPLLLSESQLDALSAAMHTGNDQPALRGPNGLNYPLLLLRTSNSNRPLISYFSK